MSMDRRMKTLLVAGFVAAMVAATGCAPKNNFPPTPGTSSVEAWVPPIPELMATSLRYVHTRHASEYPMVFNLPPNTPEWIWDDVRKRLGGDARPMMEGDRAAFSVQGVKIDGATAEVDVVYPANDPGQPELYQLLTTGLTTNPFQEWRVIFERKWRIPVSAPTSNLGSWPVHEDTDYGNTK
jgi:hypothetical protein